jgi:heat shock protein 5
MEKVSTSTPYLSPQSLTPSQVEILVNDQGNRITPSWVAFTDEERLVGDAAKNQYAANPGRTIFDIVSVIFGDSTAMETDWT